MARETSKALPRRAKDPLFQEVFKGVAIDLGCGEDALRTTAEFPNLKVEYVVDRDGAHPNMLRLDVESIGELPIASHPHLIGRYDLVYSSQCLEHCDNPFRTIFNWWRLLKVGGHMVITVPDEQLYEQTWPHRWSSGHKTTWKIRGSKPDAGWSPGAIPLRDLASSLPGARVLKCDLEDSGYDYELLARIQLGESEPTDMTMPPMNAEAWIEAVVKKER